MIDNTKYPLRLFTKRLHDEVKDGFSNRSAPRITLDHWTKSR